MFQGQGLRYVHRIFITEKQNEGFGVNLAQTRRKRKKMIEGKETVIGRKVLPFQKVLT